MAISAAVDIGGVRRAWWDDDIEQYVEVAPDGVTETLRRGYTPVELDQKFQRLTRVTTHTNDAIIRDRLKTGIPKLRDAITEADSIAASTSGNTRILATHLTTSLRANLSMARLMAGVLDIAE